MLKYQSAPSASYSGLPHSAYGKSLPVMANLIRIFFPNLRGQCLILCPFLHNLVTPAALGHLQRTEQQESRSCSEWQDKIPGPHPSLAPALFQEASAGMAILEWLESELMD